MRAARDLTTRARTRQPAHAAPRPRVASRRDVCAGASLCRTAFRRRNDRHARHCRLGMPGARRLCVSRRRRAAAGRRLPGGMPRDGRLLTRKGRVRIDTKVYAPHD
eukprot:2651546-Prymnesium_polylepis.1